MGFVKNIKSKIGEHLIPDGRDLDNDEYEDNDVEFEDEDDGDDVFSNDDEYDNYRYSPESMMNPPEYVRYGDTTDYGKEKVSVPTEQKGNIYNMNNSRPRAKFKLNFIALHDIYDAKNVATIMMDKNAMVVVNFGLLSDDQKRRAMDFLDGARYVSNALFTRFTENICAFLPEGIELHGDFLDQVELDNFSRF